MWSRNGTDRFKHSFNWRNETDRFQHSFNWLLQLITQAYKYTLNFSRESLTNPQLISYEFFREAAKFFFINGRTIFRGGGNFFSRKKVMTAIKLEGEGVTKDNPFFAASFTNPF